MQNVIIFSETRQNEPSESLPSILKLLFLISFLKILTYQKENKVSDNEIMKSIYRIIFWTKHIFLMTLLLLSQLLTCWCPGS